MSNDTSTAKVLAQIWPALIATSACAIAIASSVAVTYHIASQNAASATSTSSSEEDGEEEEDASTTKADEKPSPLRYKRVHEHWSDDQHDWVVREEKTLTPKELEEANRMLFVVKSRIEERDEPPAILLDIKSQAIIDVLREEMPESDEVFDQKPSIESHDAFRHLASLADRMAVKKDELARRQRTPNAETAVVGPSSALDEQPKKKAYTVKELEEQLDHVGVFLDMLRSEYEATQEKLDRLAKDGMASFDTLWALFSPEQMALADHEDSEEPAAFTVKTIAYDTSSTSGRYLGLSGTFLDWNGTKYQRTWRDVRIYKFRGIRKLSSLAASPLTDDMRAKLTERGRSFVKLAGVHYKSYTGSMICVSFNMMGSKQIDKRRADGRAQIDRESYRKMCPSGYGNSRSRAINLEDVFDGCTCDVCMDRSAEDLVDPDDPNAGGRTGSHHEMRVPEKDLPLLPPTVFGFSFVLKDWGQFLVQSFSDVEFDANAFDHLVLQQSHKTLIRALVESTRKEAFDSNAMISDVIKGKGGGLIIVLHGPPGTGKTLTAEAVSETLQRPLYIVSSGSLGSNAADVEKSLQDTLEIARKWRCVCLIDEADVFLEERGDHEMQRNSMVAVFLRLLEYHDGVLFLTTNRVKCFDPAFVGRFSVAIRYPDLSRESRHVIWRKFLELAGCRITTKAAPNGIVNGTESPDSSASPTPPPIAPARPSTISERALDKFAEAPLNGRVIKQLVRAATALSLSERVPLAASHVEKVLSLNRSFTEDFESPSEDIYEAPDGTSISRTHRRNLYG